MGDGLAYNASKTIYSAFESSIRLEYLRNAIRIETLCTSRSTLTSPSNCNSQKRNADLWPVVLLNVFLLCLIPLGNYKYLVYKLNLFVRNLN